MNRELTVQEAALAWVQGKRVEAARPSSAWGLIQPVGLSEGMWKPSVLGGDSGFFRFRLAPEPPAKRYRPWTPEEVPAAGRVRRKGCDSGWLMIIGCTKAWGAFVAEEGRVPLDSLLDYWEMTDGSPCGVEVES